MRKLEPNESAEFVVDAHDPNNAVGLVLRTAGTYHIAANPGDWWVDFYIPCKADGTPVSHGWCRMSRSVASLVQIGLQRLHTSRTKIRAL
jgi:hypothetical protein